MGRSIEGSPERTALLLEHKDLLDDLDERIRADSRFQEAEAEVQRCMANTGFDEFTTIEAFELQLGAEVQDLLQAHYRTNPVINLTEDQIELLTEDDVDELVASGATWLSPELLQQLADLQASEIEVAEALLSCDGLERLDNLYETLAEEHEVPIVEQLASD